MKYHREVKTVLEILFTTSNNFFSKLIQKITGEDVSHVAIEFPENSIVVHSDWRGLRISSSTYFRKKHKIVYKVEREGRFEEEGFQNLLLNHEEKSYDFGALLFLGFCLILRKYFRIPLPKSNLWQATGMFICVGFVVEALFQTQNEMMTPKAFFHFLKDKQN